jgi:hypothetical protein
MFLFPLVYILSFLKAIKSFLERNPNGILTFLVIGLPIYINSLSVTHLYGFTSLVPVLQSFKELTVLLSLTVSWYQLKKIPQLTYIDKLVLLFLGGSGLYVLLPVGSYGLITKLLAIKNLSFFCFLYLAGRIIPIVKVQVSKLYHAIGIVTVIAAIVVIYEFITNQHIHSKTGFTNFLIDFFDGEQSGNYGLIWTFETETGMKRFGSIFGNPLELGAAMILSLSVFFSYFTTADKKIMVNKWSVLFFSASFIAISLAVSRASFMGYVSVIYLYALIINNKKLLRGFYIAFIVITLYFVYFLSQTDIYEFIVSSITFTNASSMGHVLEWIDGFNAMIAKPLGMGLGESGRISMSAKENTGGENQFIITGVQVGIPLLIVYISIQVSLIKEAWKNRNPVSGKLRRIVLLTLLYRLGILIPMFTSNTESFIYISYFTWFMSGLMVNMLEKQQLLRYTIFKAKPKLN